MTDRELLISVINDSGLRRQYIAEKLGLTYQGFKLKLDGKNDFRESEMQMLVSLLHMNKTTRDRVFFAQKVDK